MNPLGVVFLDENGFTAVFELEDVAEKTVDPVTEYLIRCREQFKDLSWFRNGPAPVTGDVCAITLMSRVYNGPDEYELFNGARQRLADVLVRRFGAQDYDEVAGTGRDVFYVITKWNDQPHRTRQEVELAYDLAIAGW